MLIYGITIFISAFLLFQVQLIIAGYILPWFGGSATVWSASMLFFQTLLLIGYSYAHLLITRIKTVKRQAWVHIGMIAAAAAVIVWQVMVWGRPVLPAAALRPASDSFPVLRILLILFISVGLPFFVLSATSSLLQAWFAGIWARRSPYRLYALSNAGSLLGLLSYPFLVQPLIGLSRQAVLWAGGFVLFGLLCIFSALLFVRRGEVINPVSEQVDTTEPPGTLRRMLWVLLPAAGTVILLATTNKITMETAVIPMFWMLPLALYLLSFIFTFSGRFYRRRFGFWFAAAVAAVALIFLINSPLYSKINDTLRILIYLFIQFTACMYCHGEAWFLKPPPRHLTTFYLSVAGGGALGGLFVALIAPLLFTTIREFSLGIIACGLLAGLAMWIDAQSPLNGPRRIQWRAAAGAMAVCIAAGFYFESIARDNPIIHRDRNFYGTFFIEQGICNAQSDQGMLQLPVYALYHGQTQHGFQVKDPRLSRTATTYYTERSGVGLVLTKHPFILAADGRPKPLHVGAVGLGVGTVAAYGRKGDTYRFYEIDRDIIALSAGTNAYFSYLSESRADIEMVPGDARLKLEKEMQGTQWRPFDVLVLDAFSGDAIPIHLLTKEAFQIYRKRLKPGGIAAIHVSSKHFDLAPLIVQQALSTGFHITKYVTKEDNLYDASTWILLSDDLQLLTHFQNLRRPTPISDSYKRVPPWTDDYSNPLQLLIAFNKRPFFELYARRGE